MGTIHTKKGFIPIKVISSYPFKITSSLGYIYKTGRIIRKFTNIMHVRQPTAIKWTVPRPLIRSKKCILDIGIQLFAFYNEKSETKTK